MRTLIAVCVLFAVACTAYRPPKPCATPGAVHEDVCGSELCGPHGVCLAVQFGGHCKKDSDCSSHNCDKPNARCLKAKVGRGTCFANDDCTNNNCDITCNKCKPVPAAGRCTCNADCASQNCDVATFTCKQNARGGTCGDNRDCLSNDCQGGCCKASQPGVLCTGDSDCAGGAKCLVPRADGPAVGTCYSGAEQGCNEDGECGTNFCTTALGHPTEAVCLRGGVGAPCASDSDCQDGLSGSMYCWAPTVNGVRGVCAVRLCNLQVCDVNADCQELGPGTYSCFCQGNNNFVGSGLNTGSQIAPGCVGNNADPPLALPIGGLPVQAVGRPASACVQNWECGSQLCTAGFCALNPAGICQDNNDCTSAQFCDIDSNDHVYHIGNTPRPTAGRCRVNECVVNNGGCIPEATCSPRRGSVVCACPPGSFGEGKITHEERACWNPCAERNGRCGTVEAATCVPKSKKDVECVCHPGFFYHDGKGCVDPCLHENGGCHLFEICHADGLDDDHVNCICREGFDPSADGESCVPNPCFNKCSGADSKEPEGKFGCKCNCNQEGYVFHETEPGVGTCVPDWCQISNPCASAALCTFVAAGGLTGHSLDQQVNAQTTCQCRFGYTGNGWISTVGTGTGCTAAQCGPVNVGEIANANRGNCDGNQWTGDRCVMGCLPGFIPSHNPSARCVGATQNTSVVEFRPYRCERGDEDDHHDDHHDHDRHDRDEDIGWTCDINVAMQTECVPRSPSVGWKASGRIGLHWTALGRGVLALHVEYFEVFPGGTTGTIQTTTPITTNPGFASSFEITSLTPGSKYSFQLVATVREGTNSVQYKGKPLYAKV